MIHDRSGLPLADDVIRIREIGIEDTDFVILLRNDPRVLGSFTSGTLITKAQHEGFLHRYFSGQNTDEIYVIERAGKCVGMISLYNISGDSAEWGRIAILPERQGEGNGKRAVKLIIQRAREVGLVLLYCHVKHENLKAINLYESLGFVKKREVGNEFYMELPLDD